MRDTSARRDQTAKRLRSDGSVQVHDLALVFGVSEVTIRKDLKFLEQCGIAVRTYGGAILNSQNKLTDEFTLPVKQELNIAEKSNIAAAAANLVEPGDSIILDSGTTTCHIAAHLAGKDDLTVVTNDLGAINQLARLKNVRLIVPGGTLRRKNESFTGSLAERAIENLHVDKIFLGVDGFHIDKGVTTHFEEEATLNRLMCKNSNQVISVSDSSKFGRICLHKIIEPSGISKMITDSGIPDNYRQYALEVGIELITVAPE